MVMMMMMMVRCRHRRRGEIIQLDLLHQKGAGHDSQTQEALRMDVEEGIKFGEKRLLEKKQKKAVQRQKAELCIRVSVQLKEGKDPRSRKGLQE